jgi:hypothetical protein
MCSSEIKLQEENKVSICPTIIDKAASVFGFLLCGVICSVAHKRAGYLLFFGFYIVLRIVVMFKAALTSLHDYSNIQVIAIV